MRQCQKLKQKQIKELQGAIKTSKKAAEVKRAQAILMLNNGSSRESIRAITGYQRRQTYTLRVNYLGKGLASIADQRRGKPRELLTRRERETVIAAVKAKSPKELGYAFEHWTTGILGDYIENEYGVKYKSKTSYYLIFKKSAFTYHKPGRVYHLRDEQEVADFRKRARGKLIQAWPEENTVILAEDEMILSTQTTFQKIWLSKNENPRYEFTNRLKNRSVYGFLDIRTGIERAFKTEYQNMHVTRNILKN